MNHSPFESGSLRERLRDTTRRALATGALQPIRTRSETVLDEGVPFVLRIVDSLHRKEQQKRVRRREGAIPRNPFLPYDEELFVADASPTHVCLLNKFNVVAEHLLIVTREFEHQETALTLQDFETLLRCMNEYDGLAFYNGGRMAGASQMHKHLQLVPLPFERCDSAESQAEPSVGVPIEAAFDEVLDVAAAVDEESARLQVARRLGYRHRVARMSAHRSSDAAQSASTRWHSTYRAMLEALGLHADAEGRLPPYNLLATRQWMKIVPRASEHYEAISLNSLAFAGALLVKSEAQLSALRESGPFAALRHVAPPLE